MPSLGRGSDESSRIVANSSERVETSSGGLRLVRGSDEAGRIVPNPTERVETNSGGLRSVGESDGTGRIVPNPTERVETSSGRSTLRFIRGNPSMHAAVLVASSVLM